MANFKGTTKFPWQHIATNQTKCACIKYYHMSIQHKKFNESTLFYKFLGLRFYNTRASDNSPSFAMRLFTSYKQLKETPNI